jgi:hypothetical protein
MGNSIAVKKKKGVGGKYYRPPDVRQKDRYEPEESLNLSSQNDSSIDKVRSFTVVIIEKTFDTCYHILNDYLQRPLSIMLFILS